MGDHHGNNGGVDTQESLLNEIEVEWMDHHERTATILDTMKSILAEGNPYESGLRVVTRCWEFSKSKSGDTLCHELLKILDELYGSNSSKYLTAKLKKKALESALEAPNPSILTAICGTYKIDAKQNELTGSIIRKLMDSGMHEKALAFAKHLNLHPSYYVEMVMPFYLRNNFHLISGIIDKTPAIQGDVLRTLDEHHADSSKIRDLLRRIESTKPEAEKKSNDRRGPQKKDPVDKTLLKSLAKLITRLLKKYNLPAETCPLLQISQNRSSFRYWFMKKYRERDVSEFSWREVVASLVMDCPPLQGELLRELRNRKDMEASHYFVVKLGIPQCSWSPELTRYIEGLPSDAPSPLLDVASDNNNNSMRIGKRRLTFLTLTLREENVTFVQTMEDLNSALDCLSRTSVVGIDAEWKPVMGLLQESRISILQVATQKEAYVFDIITLNNIVGPEYWNDFFKKIFKEYKITVIGFGIREDLRKLEDLTKKPIQFGELIDLFNVQAALQAHKPDLMKPIEPSLPPNDVDKLTGLQKLTYKLLGHPLDKAEQCSDWENRPLRSAQMRYAVLDAHCLLLCWNELEKRANRMSEKLRDILTAAQVHQAQQQAAVAERKVSKTQDSNSSDSI